ncbi:periplasmic heavy metal sensor [Hyphobacterium sp. CCMP332]|nr:periplasmic heavy metal sensor [Hyphobacterium sp. CCMP332]
MKRRIKLIGGTFLAMLLLSLPMLSMAQEAEQRQKGQEMRKDRMANIEERIPNLTEDQKENIKSIRLSAMKDMKPLRNELGEKEARFKTLRSADEPDMDAINKQIDEIAALKASIAKREAKAQQDIRALLNDDQRITFDMHRERRMEKAKHKAHH